MTTTFSAKRNANANVHQQTKSIYNKKQNSQITHQKYTLHTHRQNSLIEQKKTFREKNKKGTNTNRVTRITPHGH